MAPRAAVVIASLALTLVGLSASAAPGAAPPDRLYAFGYNYYGQLGSAINNGTSNPNPTPAPVGLPGATGPVREIAAGGEHSLAVTSTGQLYAFGYNQFGELGNTINSGTNAANPTPLQVTLPAGLIAARVATGSGAEHTLVVLTTRPPMTPPPGPSPPGPPPGTAPAARPPTLSALHVSPSKLSLAGRLVNGRCVNPTQKNRKRARCTRWTALKLSYALDSAATVAFTFTRQAPGRKANGRCVTPTKKNRTHPRCTRRVTVPGRVSHPGAAGSNTFTFDGRIGGNTLGPGSYLITATPTANGQRGRPQTTAVELTT